MTTRRKLLPLMWLGSVPILAWIYSSLNTPVGDVHHLATSLDVHIPFVKWFIFPYLGWYFFVPSVLIYLCFVNRSLYSKTLISTFLSIGLCYIIYSCFQTTVPRPELTGDNLVTNLVRFLYRIDEPYNCFPSIHCLTSALMIRAAFALKRTRSDKRFRIGVTTFAILIMASTMFLKQHVILDVISGVVLANVVFHCVTRMEGVVQHPWLRPFYSWTTKWRFWSSSKYTSEMKDIQY